MSERHAVNLSLLHMLPGTLAARGLDVASVLARAGIERPEGEWSARVVTRGQICTVLEAVCRRLGEATVGLDLASDADPHELGLTGRAVFTGATLRHYLHDHMRTMPRLQSGVAFGLEVTGRRARMAHRLVGSDPNETRVLSEGAMAFEIRAFRAILGEDVALRVTFPHRARAPARLYEDRLGAEVTFARDSAGASLIEFDAALLDRPSRVLIVPPSWEEMAGAGAPTALRAEGDLLRAVAMLIPQLAAERSLTLATAAASLGQAPRSLQRRLAQLSTSWEDCLDAWRRDQARHWLGDSDAPIGVIADRLGYAHGRHFLRAFRRWEDRAPSDFRRAMAGRSGAKGPLSAAPD